MKLSFINASVILFLICSCGVFKSVDAQFKINAPGSEDAETADEEGSGFVTTKKPPTVPVVKTTLAAIATTREKTTTPIPTTIETTSTTSTSPSTSSPTTTPTTTESTTEEQTTTLSTTDVPTTTAPTSTSIAIVPPMTTSHTVHSTEQRAGGMGPGVIGAIICGCVILLTAIIIILVCIIQKNRKADRDQHLSDDYYA